MVMLNDEFQKARDRAYEYIATLYACTRARVDGVNRHGDVEQWIIKDFVEVGDAVLDITLNVKFPFDFPLVLPRAYLIDPEAKLLPHLDEEGFVCTFDSESSQIRNDVDPGQLVYEVIAKAKRTVEA